jgi:hypothetical protein
MPAKMSSTNRDRVHSTAPQCSRLLILQSDSDVDPDFRQHVTCKSRVTYGNALTICCYSYARGSHQINMMCTITWSSWRVRLAGPGTAGAAARFRPSRRCVLDTAAGWSPCDALKSCALRGGERGPLRPQLGSTAAGCCPSSSAALGSTDASGMGSAGSAGDRLCASAAGKPAETSPADTVTASRAASGGDALPRCQMRM